MSSFFEDDTASLPASPNSTSVPMALKEEEETHARLSTARRRFNKPPPLSLKMSYRVIGPKLQLKGLVLPSGKHPLSRFPSRKVKAYRWKRRGLGSIGDDASTWATCDLHRRRDDSASGRELSAEQKMAQPGTDAQAMERPVQTARVHAGEHDCCGSTRNSPSFLKTRSTSACRSRSGGQGKFLTFPIVAGSDVAEGLLKNNGFTFAVADSPERLYFSLLILNDYSHKNCTHLKHDTYYKAYN